MKFTVLGSTGFIGSAMVRHLRAEGMDVDTPPRDMLNLRGNIGHVIYAIGLTGNFRQQPDAAIEAHVNVLRRLMDGAEFDSWLYLSSTRVYGGLAPDVPATEDSAVPIRPGADSLYDLSKLLGESICLSRPEKTVRVARLSNVFGVGQSEHTFLGSVVRDLTHEGKSVIGQSPESSKDYISIDKVVKILALIALKAKERLYNVASGHGLTHRELADVFSGMGYKIDFAPGAPTRVFPPADISRITREFGINTQVFPADIAQLLERENKVKHEKIRE
ncbi:MAG: NAD-dependent epimerase/dehydratase family protein [Alphaproteobacteria bacterium]